MLHMRKRAGFETVFYESVLFLPGFMKHCFEIGPSYFVF